MEDNKIRIGITQGDINGVGYEVILKTFSDPTMLELCTPIIYGSPKVAAYHRKALDIQANFSIVNTASEAGYNRLSVVNCTDDEVKVEFSKTINPTFFMELHKFSKVVGYLQNRHEKREKEAAVFFKRGIEEGYFRKDINYKLASRIGDMSMHSFMEKQLYQEFGVEEIFRSFIFVFIRGFCTQKGIKLLDSRLKTLV